MKKKTAKKAAVEQWAYPARHKRTETLTGGPRSSVELAGARRAARLVMAEANRGGLGSFAVSQIAQADSLAEIAIQLAGIREMLAFQWEHSQAELRKLRELARGRS